ncbi:MAG TPA: hypothetical protein VMS02_01885, partial [Solirubrobacteraceae bacterium]|nr:hypothetical protein [Solirubrobacteraceae bacterium]
MLGVVSATAHAEWGEQGHFAIPTGSGEGQVNFSSSSSVTAFATDSADSSYYIGDEPTAGEFRIQRFVAGKAEASISFSPPEPKKAHDGTGETGVGLQLAVDPVHNRVYALVLYKRRSESEKEEKEETKEEEQFNKEIVEEEKGEKPQGSRLIKSPHSYFPLDSEERTAGELYAFELTGGKLVSAKEVEGKPAPIVGETTSETSTSAFADQSEKSAEALLDPRGIAVDPSSGDIAILGVEDEQSNEKVEKEEGEKQCRGAAQFVLIAIKSGKLTGKLGHRYVDKADALRPEQLGCEAEEVADVPLSPVITPGGNLLIYSGAQNEGQIWEMPTPGSETGEGEVSTTPTLLFYEHQLGSLLNLEPPENGGPAVMSFVPEGASEGRIYLSVQGLAHEPIPLALHYVESADKSSEVSELGWTAGGAGETCGLPSPDNVAAVMGAGHEQVLALDAYLEEAPPHNARVETFAFGPGGNTSGCPKPTLTAPQMVVGLAQNAHEARTHEPVAFASELKGADAKSVKWELKYKDAATGEEGSETVEQTSAQLRTPAGEYEFLPLKYEFKHAGSYEISEVVQGDDLADESIAAPEVLHATVTALTPILKPAPPKAVRVDEEEATISVAVEDPNESEKPKLHLKKVKWEFGDGSPAVEEHPGELPNPGELQVKHKFISRCGSKDKCKIKLTVEDTAAEGTPSATSF